MHKTVPDEPPRTLRAIMLSSRIRLLVPRTKCDGVPMRISTTHRSNLVAPEGHGNADPSAGITRAGGRCLAACDPMPNAPGQCKPNLCTTPERERIPL